MLRAPHEKGIIESIEDKVIEKADSEGEVKGALKVMEILEQTDNQKLRLLLWRTTLKYRNQPQYHMQ